MERSRGDEAEPRPSVHGPGKCAVPDDSGQQCFYEIAARTGHVSYFTMRGCPFRCSFCYNLAFNKRKWRSLPMERLEEDLRRVRREVPFDHVYFVDDYVGHRVERLRDLASTMNRIQLTWHSSIRVNDISAETVKILADGNCRLMLLGVESAAEDVQQGILVKDYRQGIDDVRRCVTSIARTNITPLYSFMYNVPGETSEQLKESCELAEWIHRTDRRARIGFYAYTPYPGTPLYNQALQSGFRPPSRLEGWGQMSLSNDLNPKLRDLYYIAGLRFRGRKGDRTDENFPGLQRLRILPFEAISRMRWRMRSFVYTDYERRMVTNMIEHATCRAPDERVGTTMMEDTTEICIWGAGLVGYSLACAWRNAGGSAYWSISPGMSSSASTPVLPPVHCMVCTALSPWMPVSAVACGRRWSRRWHCRPSTLCTSSRCPRSVGAWFARTTCVRWSRMSPVRNPRRVRSTS